MVDVSIICNTFNHEKYIKDALEGFVMQKTNFEYEVLIHDDASTDRTADIIREYEKAYPNLIKPIYQAENQYSKGVKISATYQYPRARGRYIAICEGDDYWTDPLKLQKQFDAMEQHPEVDMCAHKAEVVEANTQRTVRWIAPKKEDTVLQTGEVILGGGGYVATNSLFYRKSIAFTSFEFRKVYSIDFSLQILGALRGGILYLNDCMSVYRAMAEGSWTARNSSRERIKKVNQKMKIMLNVLNQETDFRYAKEIRGRMARDQLNLLDYSCSITESMKLLRDNWYAVRKMTGKEVLKLGVKVLIPGIKNKWRSRCIH